MTTLCVFIPLIFLTDGGRFKLYLENIALTICVVIVASLVVALTVVPMVAALILRGQQARPSKMLHWLGNVYGRALNLTLRHRLIFVVLIFLSIFTGASLGEVLQVLGSSMPLMFIFRNRANNHFNLNK